MMRYYMFGSYPPPLGGASVFAYRYKKLLESKGIEVVARDLSKISRLKVVLILLNITFNPFMKIFHLNKFDFYLMTALIFRPFGGKIIFWDHSGRAIETFNQRRRIIFKIFLKKVNKCYLVSEHLRKYYNSNNYLLPKKTCIRNAYIKPPLEEEEAIVKTYSDDVLEFIEAHRPLIIANAFKIVFYKNCDLYGLDLCVRLLARLKKDFSEVGLLFALAEIGDHHYFQQINQMVKEFELEENILFMTGQKELWPLLKKADLMIRPTNTDGYAVSIAEAIYFECPVIASDVCQRPNEVILFANRDLDDLVEKTTEVLKKCNKIIKSI